MELQEVKSEYPGHVAIKAAGVFLHATGCLIKKGKKILQIIVKKNEITLKGAKLKLH